jgi:predicted MFS family arabinose efflux permease
MQAGNAGGVAIGGLGLAIAERSSQAVAAAVVAVVLFACCLPLAGIPMERRGGGAAGVRAALHELWSDMSTILLSRAGILALLACLLPIGVGAASNLFAAIATDWNAPAALVSSVTGLLGGVASVLGCLVGGRLSDAMARRSAYVLSGIAVALAAFVMAAAPRTPASFAVTALTYYFAYGLTYSTFCGFVLQLIGKGAAATKYNVLASISNVPILLMTQLDGWVGDQWGRTAMLVVDGTSGLVGAAILFAVAALLRTRVPVRMAGASAGPA